MILQKEFYAYELAYLEKRLEGLPEVRIRYRTRYGKTYKVIRWKDKTGNHEITYDRAHIKFREVADLREYLVQRFSERSRLWSKEFKGSYQDIVGDFSIKRVNSKIDGKFFSSAQGQCLPYEETKCICHRGYWLRSRAEFAIALMLDDLGLEYKYEVYIPGTNKTADFLIYIPSVDACIFLEFLGMTNDRTYRATNDVKFLEILNSGYVFHQDYEILTGNENDMPNEEQVISAIAHCTYNLIRSRIELEPNRLNYQ